MKIQSIIFSLGTLSILFWFTNCGKIGESAYQIESLSSSSIDGSTSTDTSTGDNSNTENPPPVNSNIPSPSNALPGEITINTVTPKITSKQDGELITVSGKNFGRKLYNDSPILFDFADKAYEYGVLNTHQSSFTNLQPILRETYDKDTLWTKPSIGSGGGVSPPVITTELTGRSATSQSHYLFKGSNSFLGWPKAYGGSNTATDREKLYISWFIKMKYDPRYYWAVSPESASGTFQPGEKIVFDNGIEGTYIGFATEGHAAGMYQFEIPDQRNSNNLVGRIITGQISKAKTVFPTSFAAGSGVGFESPGSNKYLRIWEHPYGNEGVRISWTQCQLHGGWYYAPMTANKWHHMEVMLDLKNHSITAWTDRTLVGTVDLDEDDSQISGALSPTIALLGFNGKIQLFQTTEIDDIYMDSSFARVAIGDKPNFIDLDHYELQTTETWNDDQITFKLNKGSIDTSKEYYLYIFNEQGEVNQVGFKLN